MRKILSILVLMMFAVVAKSQVYNATVAGIPINKAMAPAQATPMDARTMLFDGTNFIYRAYKDTQEVITYLNLPKYRVGNAVYIVDSGGTLNGNGTYTNFHATYWTFQDGVADVNLIKLNWNGSGGGCSSCFSTTTQLTDSSFKLNRSNGTSDTVVVDVASGVFITTANNFLTLTGTNVQAGGPLVKDTYANGGGHVFGITGNIFEQGQGATLTAANVMTTGSDGNSFPVIGSTQINAITTTNRQPGTIISFIFTGTPLLRNNQVAPAGSAPMLLAGGVDYTAATNDVIFFLYDGTYWHETSRKLAGAVIPVTANNAITLSGSLLQWGGTEIKNTTVAGNGFYTAFNGGRVEMPMGLQILAAGDLFVGNDGNFFSITGTTQINAIGTINWQAGSEISFEFTSIVTLKNNTAGGTNTAPMLLAGRTDYTSAVGDYIGFIYDGTNWLETNRKLAGSVTSVIANNGLLVSGGTIIQLGAPLIRNTTVNTSTFNMLFNGTPGVGNAVMGVQNTGTTGGALSAINNSTFESSIIAFNSNVGPAISANSAGGYSIYGQTTDANTTGVNTNLRLLRNVKTLSVLPTAGYGESIIFDLAVSSPAGSAQTANTLQSTWENTVSATATSSFSILGTVNGVSNIDQFDMDGTYGTFYEAIRDQQTLSSTNTIVPQFYLQRLTSGTAGTGIGVAQYFQLSTTSNPGGLTTNSIEASLTDATATATSRFNFKVIGNGGSLTNALTLDGNLNMTTYGGQINHITTTAAGSYNILATDWTVVATGTTSTWTFPTLVSGQIWNLVNQGSGSISLGTSVTTANGTTSSTITAGSNYIVQYDGSVLRKIN